MTVDPDTDRYMSVEEVAAFFAVTKYTIREWIKHEKLSAVKISTKWKILKSEVIRYANAQYGEK